MIARARIEFRLNPDEFWELTLEEWNAYCHVGDRFAIMLDRQFAATRQTLAAIFASSDIPPDADRFRLLKDPDEPDADDAFDVFKRMLI